jgi:hypothetical protein
VESVGFDSRQVQEKLHSLACWGRLHPAAAAAGIPFCIAVAVRGGLRNFPSVLGPASTEMDLVFTVLWNIRS